VWGTPAPRPQRAEASQRVEDHRPPHRNGHTSPALPHEVRNCTHTAASLSSRARNQSLTHTHHDWFPQSHPHPRSSHIDARSRTHTHAHSRPNRSCDPALPSWILSTGSIQHTASDWHGCSKRHPALPALSSCSPALRLHKPFPPTPHGLSIPSYPAHPQWSVHPIIPPEPHGLSCNSGGSRLRRRSTHCCRLRYHAADTAGALKWAAGARKECTCVTRQCKRGELRAGSSSRLGGLQA